MFQDKVIVITGGAGGIGKCIAEEFQKNGAHVCVIDTGPGAHYVGDIRDKAVLEDFARRVSDPVPTPSSSPQAASAIPKTSQTWCCSWRQARQVSSPAKTSSSTAARPGS